MFQKAVCPWWNLAFSFAVPAAVSMRFGETFFNGFLLAGCLRYIWILHVTWAVNSVVHAYGGRPYNPEHATTENGWVSFLAFGEGWHNWHHAFDWDYATAE